MGYFRVTTSGSPKLTPLNFGEGRLETSEFLLDQIFKDVWRWTWRTNSRLVLKVNVTSLCFLFVLIKFYWNYGNQVFFMHYFSKFVPGVLWLELVLQVCIFDSAPVWLVLNLLLSGPLPPIKDHSAMEDISSGSPRVSPNQLGPGGHGPEVHHRPHLQWLHFCLWVWHFHQALPGKDHNSRVVGDHVMVSTSPC